MQSEQKESRSQNFGCTRDAVHGMRSCRSDIEEKGDLVLWHSQSTQTFPLLLRRGA